MVWREVDQMIQWKRGGMQGLVSIVLSSLLTLFQFGRNREIRIQIGVSRGVPDGMGTDEPLQLDPSSWVGRGIPGGSFQMSDGHCRCQQVRHM